MTLVMFLVSCEIEFCMVFKKIILIHAPGYKYYYTYLLPLWRKM